ncbi:MAG TPA: hypothetical protein VF516_26155 [Kofleriaceae bacterium]
MSAGADSLQYLRGWMAALDEMRRPDWREVYDQTSRDIAAGRGRDLETVAQELGLESRSPHGRPRHRPKRR